MSSLIPEKRVNKNGVAVTKHIRASVSTVPKLFVPAPKLSTTADADDLARKLALRDAYQLEEFPEQDLKDAAKIRGILAALAPERNAVDLATAKIQLVKRWQEPRLPHPRHDRIRPIVYPWSETARDLFFAGKTTGNLTLEHVKPVSYLIEEVLFPAAEDTNCTDQMFLDLLVKEHSRLSFTVVTEVEDNMLNFAKLKNRHVESEDDWARYKEAKIDTSTFMALTDDPRFKAMMKDLIKVNKSGKISLLAPSRSIEV
jgi:hypothetical protein